MLLKSQKEGFSLLEILLVLGIISVLFGIFIPNLGFSPVSQMRQTLAEVTGTIRAAYEQAIFQSQTHRIVIDPFNNEYWVESSKTEYTRPPMYLSGDDKETRTRYYTELDDMSKTQRKMTNKDDAFYRIRSLVYYQRSYFKINNWTEVNDSLLTRRKLPGDVAFFSLASEIQTEKLESSKFTKDSFVYIYFSPSGGTQKAMIQLTVKNSDDASPKYTIILDGLTGKSDIIEGFKDVDFSKI